mmetsp:Transcript_1879/g.3236  ORF Transcript_1879/g.3236 Transcript_1879/m.3236 type:complete len:377 (+) Transcript_1879:296-1426(+)
MTHPGGRKSPLDFWRRGLSIVALYILQGVFAEDIIIEMNSKGHNLSWFISFLTVSSQLVYAYVSMLRSKHKQGHSPSTIRYLKHAYRWEYAVASACIVFYQIMNNSATFFVRFNTVQLCKTSKIVAAMAVSWLLLSHRYSRRAILYALCLVSGLYILSRADLASERAKKLPQADEATRVARLIQGFSLVFISMIFIAVHNVVQEAVVQHRPWRFGSVTMPEKKPAGQVQDELIFFTNTVTTLVLGMGSIFNGEMVRGVLFYVFSPRRVLFEQLVIIVINVYGQRLMLDISRTYGSTSATIVVTVRKTITFAISVMFFPKPFTVAHLFALILVSCSACLLQIQIMRDEERSAALEANKGHAYSSAKEMQRDEYPIVV